MVIDSEIEKDTEFCPWDGEIRIEAVEKFASNPKELNIREVI